MDAARSYWPIGDDDLESYYDKVEGVPGARGKAGKLQAKKIVGGHIFQPPRSSEFPIPPLTPSHNMVSFEKAGSTRPWLSIVFHARIQCVASVLKVGSIKQGEQCRTVIAVMFPTP